MTQKKKIFLASSSELVDDRQAFEIFISRENSRLITQGIYLELVIWEDFLDAMSQTRLQDEYNKAILDCDIFIMLFFTKVGKYTREEFQTAYDNFKATGKPIVYTYFKDADINMGNISDEVLSLLQFQKDLKELGHFFTSYKSTSDLLFHFSNQLKKIFDNNVISIKDNTPHTPNDEPDPKPQLDLTTIKKELKLALVKDMGKGFQALEKILSSESDHFNTFIGLQSRYKKNRKEEMQNIISFENAKMEYNKINHALQYVIDEIEKEDLK